MIEDRQGRCDHCGVLSPVLGSDRATLVAALRRRGWLVIDSERSSWRLVLCEDCASPICGPKAARL